MANSGLLVNIDFGNTMLYYRYTSTGTSMEVISFLTMPITVRLKSGRNRSYAVTVTEGLLRQLPSVITRAWRGRSLFMISDATVSDLYGRSLQHSLWKKGVDVPLFDFAPGEESKNLDVVQRLYTELLAHHVRRDSLIIAIGGGVVGDIAGFVAATILRGVQYVHVPTTLLAQVDSSVGGKVGIDHPLGKNLIGAFYQPAAVFVDPTVLRTLSRAEFRNGLAEIIKIAAALDEKFFARLERSATTLLPGKATVLVPVIARAIGLKRAVVERDEFESGMRKALNCGHTIGHAVEASSGFAIPHGHAVAIGVVAESRIAVSLGVMKEKDLLRVIALMEDVGLPTELPPSLDRNSFFDALAQDKKATSRGGAFALLKRIGQSALGVPVPTAEVEKLLSLAGVI